MHFLTQKLEFPPLDKASVEGLLAVGGDLSAERLLLAYQSGIFPWFNEDEPILWWSPNPRFVLVPENLKVSKSMKKLLKKNCFEVTYNNAFKEVITECSRINRTGQPGTWITTSMIASYIKLHELGYAKSVEVWQNNKLVGGLYGIDLGNGVFCGESMFAKISNASKAGFISFVKSTQYKLIDCQLYTAHLKSLGAEEMPREEFLKYL